MRIGGLASGLDTDSMVKEMMKPHQMKVDKAKQDKVIVEYKQQLYRDVMTDMRELHTKYFDISSGSNKNSNLLLSSNYSTVNFTSSDSGVVTAKGLAGSKTGTYDVTVERLASASTMTIDQNVMKSVGVGISDGSENQFQLILGEGNRIDVKITDDIKIKDKDGKEKIDMKKLKDAINKSIETFNSDSDNKNKIDIKLEYSELGDNLRISGNKTGQENHIKLGMINKNGDKLQTPPVREEAKNSRVVLTDSYGNTNTVIKPTNSFTLDNVQYTLNGVSEMDKDGKKVVTKLKGNHDSSEVVNNIKSFVDDYNKMIDKINGKLVEKRDKAYMPLTEDQKKEMSEDERRLWESKTKQGLLRNDDILESTINQLLSIISTKSGTQTQLKDIGITPFSDYKTGKGKIELDEEKLEKALTENGEETRKMLTETFDSMKKVLYDTAVSTSSTLGKKAGYEGSVNSLNNELTKQMDLKQKSIDKMVKDLKIKENKYYAEFTRLEVAMNKANAQMGQFMQSMG